MFSPKTSTLEDPDIKNLVQKYPVIAGSARNSNLNETLSDRKNDKNFDFVLGPKAVIRQFTGQDDVDETQCGNSVLLKKCIDAITKNIDRIDRESKSHYKEMLTRMVAQDIRDQELKKTMEVLKELESQVPSRLPTDFNTKMAELREQCQIAEQVAMEYHTGRFDFSKLKGMSLKKKK